MAFLCDRRRSLREQSVAQPLVGTVAEAAAEIFEAGSTANPELRRRVVGHCTRTVSSHNFRALMQLNST